MTELEKIAYAKSFIDKLANGINPVDNSTVPDGDVINNVRLSRCFFYVSDILRHVIENGGIAPAPQPRGNKSKKQPYYLSPEQAEMFEYSDIPITATEILNRIISVGPQEGTKKLPKRNLTKWLLCLDLIEEIEINNTKIKRPTNSGKEIGISLEERQGKYGNYYVILYNRDAQQFIIDNIEAMLAFDNETYRSKLHLDNQGKPWDREQDERLLALFNEGHSLKDIAVTLQRGEKAIRSRLRHNGIDLATVSELKRFNIEDKIPQSPTNKEFANAKSAEITCQSCRFARSGDCFPQKEVCADYEKAYNVPTEERTAWPEMGDASYLRQKGRHR